MYRGPSPCSRALASQERLTRSAFAAEGGGRSSSSSASVGRSFITALREGQSVTAVHERTTFFWIRVACKKFWASKLPLPQPRAARPNRVPKRLIDARRSALRFNRKHPVKQLGEPAEWLIGHPAGVFAPVCNSRSSRELKNVR